MTIVVLDGNENQAVASVRSLARAGYRVSVGADTKWSKAGWSRHCSRSFSYPAPQEDADAFVASIAAEVGRERGTLVLPMSERTALPISRDRAAIAAAGGRLVLPPHDIVLEAFDKTRTTTVAQSLGIEVPRTIALSSGADARAHAATLPYPVVVKPGSSHEYTSGGTVRTTGAPVYVSDIERPVLADIMSYVPFAGFGPYESYEAEHTLRGGEHLSIAGLEIESQEEHDSVWLFSCR